MKNKRCSSCIYREQISGKCSNDKLSEDFFFTEEEAKDMLIYPYNEGGYFLVGENFGCIHYRKLK